jgi:hypothetical protein
MGRTHICAVGRSERMAPIGPLTGHRGVAVCTHRDRRFSSAREEESPAHLARAFFDRAKANDLRVSDSR